jgi:hypothetical protein
MENKYSNKVRTYLCFKNLFTKLVERLVLQQVTNTVFTDQSLNLHIFREVHNNSGIIIQGGSNMTGTICV